MALLPLLLLSLLTISCTDSDCLVHSYQQTGSDVWLRADTLRYEIPEAPASGIYTISVEMRTGETFSYRYIYMAIERHMHHPDYLHCDTIRFDMARDGVHLDGRGSTITTFCRPALNIRLCKGQSGEVRLLHLMSREVLPDIREVGVRICKTDQ